jgi:hypothetical protein
MPSGGVNQCEGRELKAQAALGVDSENHRENKGDGRATPSGSPSANAAKPSVETLPDAIELALAEALRGASASGQWDVVAKLASELEARRRARASVPSLDEARAKRR